MPEDHPALLLYGVEIHAQSSNTHPFFQDFLLDGAAGGRLVFSFESSGHDDPTNYDLSVFFFCLSFSNIVIANIAILNPIMQISVPLSEILEFINPVKPFISASKMKQRHITNAILETTV